MPKLSEQQMLKKLEKFNTPTVGNVVATFGDRDPLCLSLYNPWYGRWYTDQSLRCIYPEIGPRIGYALTVVYSLPDPNYKRWTFNDLIDAMDKARKPIVIVAQQDFPPDILIRNGLFGGIMSATFNNVVEMTAMEDEWASGLLKAKTVAEVKAAFAKGKRK